MSFLVLLACTSGPVFTEVPVESSDGGAIRAWASVDDWRKETFVFGDDASTPLADYLFVVDSSPSTKQIIEKLTAGFAAMADERVWPSRARIAVMNTIPADPDDLTKAHPAMDDPTLSAREPGFGRLVSRDGIARFRRTASLWQAMRFQYDGCDAWFGPGDVDANGVPCFLGNTQTSRTIGPLEAGLTAFGQLLERNAGKPTFRSGAAVNVIFVSDTHDPGFDPFKKNGDPDPRWARIAPLEKSRPTFAQLRDLLSRDNVVSSFRLHAIAPEEECVERWMDIDGTYFDEVAASGGKMIDICGAEASDYADFLRSIADAPVDAPIFPLATPATTVRSVVVDGESVDWSILPDRRTIVAQPELTVGTRELDVVYRAVDAEAHPAVPDVAPLR
jgi:hypothetical protein